MRKREMSEEQLRQRSVFVDTLTGAGWRGTNFNHNFDDGLWSAPEASMTYANPHVSLRFDMSFDDPRMVLYVDAKNGKTLGLVFKCQELLASLLSVVIEMQDTLAPDNINDKRELLLAACSNMFKISAGGDKLIPLKPKKSASK